MNYKKEAEFIYNFTKNVIDECGPRLPGSPEEAKSVPIIADTIEKAIGKKAVVESFKLSAKASIGSIPVLGIVGYLAMVAFYLSPIATIIIATLGFTFAILQIFCYTGIFDFIFKRTVSHNVYGVLDPPEGEVKYTLVYSGHNDSSWNWNHSKKQPKTMIAKTIFGVVGVFYLMILSFVALGYGILSFKSFAELDAVSLIIYILPLISVITNYWLLTFLSWDKKIASPGAMDNLTGVGLSIAMGRYFKQNPKLHPKGARIIVMGIGAEEAGLKGSMAFVKKHVKKDDGLLIKPYVINLDSFRDYEHFNVIKGDLWLFSRFDKNMRTLALNSLSEVGFRPQEIINPIGGCDSTPFARKKVPTVTLCAQNPTATDYYHTSNDSYENLDMQTLEKACEVVEKFTEKLSASILKSMPKEDKQ